jgi:hypothetical protein
MATVPSKVESPSVSKSGNVSGPRAMEGNRSLTAGYPAISTTVPSPPSTTKLHIGLVVPSKSFGVREYTRAFHASITGLQTRTRGRKLKLFNRYDINPRYDMKPLTPSPTGRNDNMLYYLRYSVDLFKSDYAFDHFRIQIRSKFTEMCTGLRPSV